MNIVQHILPLQYSVILGSDGKIECVRLHSQQQTVDDDTGEVIADKILISTVAQYREPELVNEEQLGQFRALINDLRNARAVEAEQGHVGTPVE